MIGLFVKLALLVAAAHSSCHNRKQKARCKALQQRKADTEHEVSAVRERNEKFDAEHKNEVKRRDSAWRKRMSELHCDAFRQHDELRAQVAHVASQVQRVRRQLRVNGSCVETRERAAKRLRELHGIHACMRQKVERRQRQIAELEQKLRDERDAREEAAAEAQATPVAAQQCA